MSKEYAESLEKSNRWQEALDVYKELLLSDKNNIKIHAKIGWCQSRLQQYEEAIQSFMEICNRQPQSARWPYMVGYQYYCMQDWPNAIDWFKKALSLYPDYFIVKYRLSYALIKVSGNLFRLKKPDYLEAMKHLEECQQLWVKMSDDQKKKNRSTYADVCFQQGKIYIEREDYDKSIKYFKIAFEIDPNSLNYQYQYAKTLCICGKYEEAIKILPKDESKYYVKELKAEILTGLNNYNEALNILFDCIKRRNRDYLLRQIALIYLQLNNTKEALGYAKKAISMNRENHKNHYILARILFNQGLLSEAKHEAKLADRLKMKKYGTEFSEAKALLEEIEELNYNNDEDIAEKISSEKRQTGIIKRYIKEKGYGFIESNDKSYFFHITDIPMQKQSQVNEGVLVSFEEKTSPKGLVASNIIIID